MKIEFAPLNVPLERRLQTLAAAAWVASMIFLPIISCAVVVYVLIFTRFWPIILLYMAWQYYDKDTPYTGGLKFCYFRYSPLWKYFVDYFPIRLVRTVELSPDKNYLFAVYPHGLLSAGTFGNFGSAHFKKLFPNLHISQATLDVNFNIPLHRDYLIGIGAVSASKESLCNILGSKEKGRICALILGGTAECYYAKPGPYRIILSKRKGFIKVALITGCSLVPVFSFGEINLYDQVAIQPGSRLGKFQEWFKKKTGLAFPIPIGRGFFQYSFGILPRRSPITTVVGAPIEVPKITNPTEEDINRYHEIFTQKLIELFNEHKAKYEENPESALLIIE